MLTDVDPLCAQTQLQDKKRDLAAAALSGDKFKTGNKLGLEDIMALFKVILLPCPPSRLSGLTRELTKRCSLFCALSRITEVGTTPPTATRTRSTLRAR